VDLICTFWIASAVPPALTPRRTFLLLPLYPPCYLDDRVFNPRLEPPCPRLLLAAGDFPPSPLSSAAFFFRSFSGPVAGLIFSLGTYTTSLPLRETEILGFETPLCFYFSAPPTLGLLRLHSRHSPPSPFSPTRSLLLEGTVSFCSPVPRLSR